MRRLRAATFISLDGVMQGPGGPNEDLRDGFRFGGWVAPHFDEKGGRLMGQAMGEDYDLLLGRRTYEIFAAHWPHYDDEIGRRFNAINKYVVAGPGTQLGWANSHRLEGDAADAVRSLKATEGRDLLLQGSGRLIQTLLGAGLIDEMTLLIHPVVLGQGRRLFEPGAISGGWNLVSTDHTGTGMVVSRYRFAGREVATGTFESQPPHPDELARRERWAKER